MSLDYIRDIQPLEGSMTDAQIADHYRHRTAGPIPCPAAKVILEENGLVIEDPTNSSIKTGTLIDRYNAMPAGQLKALLGWFVTHVFGRGEQISSDTTPRDAQLAAVLADLPPALQTVGAELIALGGGQPYLGIADTDIAQIRTDYNQQQQDIADQQARQVAYGECRDAAQAGLDAAQTSVNNQETPAQIKAAYNANSDVA